MSTSSREHLRETVRPGHDGYRLTRQLSAVRIAGRRSGPAGRKSDEQWAVAAWTFQNAASASTKTRSVTGPCKAAPHDSSVRNPHDEHLRTRGPAQMGTSPRLSTRSNRRRRDDGISIAFRRPRNTSAGSPCQPDRFRMLLRVFVCRIPLAPS
jgi:hypothetical protein